MAESINNRSIDTAAVDPYTVQQNRKKLAAMLIIPMLIILSAQAMWLAVQHGYLNIVDIMGTKNKGQLYPQAVQVAPLLSTLSTLPATDQAGLNVFEPEKQQWYLVVKEPAVCDNNCQDQRLLSQNIHIALNREQHRLTRLLIQPQENAQALAANASDDVFPGKTRLAFYQPDHWQKFEQTYHLSDTHSHLLLMDGRGFAVAHYPLPVNGKDVLHDIKYLLKTTREVPVDVQEG